MRLLLTFSVYALVIGAALGGLAAPRNASADWPPFGRAISAATGSQVHPAIVTDGAGGAVISWQDHRAARINLFAQHVLASGEVDGVWPVDGRALLDPTVLSQEVIGIASPVMVSDGAGGGIVAWEDNRSDTSETDVFAQHVLASGVVDPAWPVNGTPLVVLHGLQTIPVIVSDGAGGAIVAWMDTRSGPAASHVFAQHVLASGLVDSRWPLNGLAVVAAAGAQVNPTITDDGSGGAIITWHDSRSVVTGLDVYAQHVLNSGVVDPAWPINGRALCTASGDQGNPAITADGAHGAIVAWSDSRVVGTSHIFAEHVLETGVVDPAWPVNGRAISAAGLLESRPLLVPDGAGGAVITWQAFTVHLNMYAQHVTAAGVIDPAWTVGGRALSITNRQQDHADIVSDGAGGAVVAWADSFNIVAQHVLATGAIDATYPDTGRAVCNLPSSQGDVALVATPGAGAIATWTDGRNLTSPDIFALQVLLAATADVPGSVVAPRTGISFARPSPNPAREPLLLRFALPRETSVRLTIYDAGGRRVRELASGTRPAGEHAIQWDLRDEAGVAVPAGLYFAQLAAEGRALTQRVVALK
jgi:hypothetical protein